MKWQGWVDGLHFLTSEVLIELTFRVGHPRVSCLVQCAKKQARDSLLAVCLREVIPMKTA